jgi:hypothetical protein
VIVCLLCSVSFGVALLTYILPAIILGCSVGITKSHYLDATFCWLDNHQVVWYIFVSVCAFAMCLATAFHALSFKYNRTLSSWQLALPDKQQIIRSRMSLMASVLTLAALTICVILFIVMFSYPKIKTLQYVFASISVALGATMLYMRVWRYNDWKASLQAQDKRVSEILNESVFKSNDSSSQLTKQQQLRLPVATIITLLVLIVVAGSVVLLESYWRDYDLLTLFPRESVDLQGIALYKSRVPEVLVVGIVIAIVTSLIAYSVLQKYTRQHFHVSCWYILLNLTQASAMALLCVHIVMYMIWLEPELSGYLLCHDTHAANVRCNEAVITQYDRQICYLATPDR